MKRITFIALAIIFIQIISLISLKAQTNPVLLIDNDSVAFNSGISLPYWLKAGQKITLLNNVQTISILEFSIDTTNNLKFSQALSLSVSSSGSQTVPTGKVWKIEAFGMNMSSLRTINTSSIANQSSGSNTSVIDTTSLTNSFVMSANTSKPSIFSSPKTFSTPGTYPWIVPPGVTQICVEVWGGGGNGGVSNIGGGAGSGGGGGYGYQCFNVVPGTSYNVTVGGSGEASSLGSLISATGGTNGADASSGGAAGIGGTSTASFKISGFNGSDGSNGANLTGGSGANGGSGGTFLVYLQRYAPSPCAANITGGQNGNSPGGGGGTGGQIISQDWAPFSGSFRGGTGAAGQVIIYW